MAKGATMGILSFFSDVGRRAVRTRKWVNGIGGQVLCFLGVVAKNEVHRWNHTFQPYHHADLCRAFRDYLPARGFHVEPYGIDGLVFPGMVSKLDALINTGPFSEFSAVGRFSLATGPEQHEEMASRAAFFVSGGDFPYVFVIDSEQGFFPSLTLMGATPKKQGAVEAAAGLMKEIEAWIIDESCLRGQLLRPLFRPGEAAKVDILPMANSDSFELQPELVSELEETFLDFLSRREELEEAGIECQRGLLLCGPPGTGKTSTCRYLKQRLPDHTMILVASEALLTLKECFDLARRFSPAILVIEDVDGIAQMRDSNQANWVLGELMNQMDGLQARDQVAVLLTSNSWEFLEKALAERPGRVDHILVYDAPDAVHRRVLLGRFLGSLLPELPVEALVPLTDGLTPAQLKEVVKRAAVASMRRYPPHTWSRSLHAEDLRHSVDSVRTSPLARTRRTIGLRAIGTRTQAAGGKA
ncbi:MAG: ATP-binding protein [Candidatus Wallbacteria bacterium]|nr:ATP-binding protein [Candidatus Wallbacteria bacterium]